MDLQELNEGLCDAAYDAGWSDYEKCRWLPPVDHDLAPFYETGFWDAVKSYEEDE